MIRIGSGAGFAGDRLEPAVLLAEKGQLDYLVLECLAERTIALAQKRKSHDPSLGYDALLQKRMELLLPAISKNNVRLITNMGAANPIAAAEKIVEIAKRLGISLKVAALTGDDILKNIDLETHTLETKRPLSEYEHIISANAYIGIEGLLDALATDADIIVTGRVSDPSLFLAPMVHHFGWSLKDLDRLAKGTVIGHLLECAGQVTGGYFSDTLKKTVPDLANLGFPIVEVNQDGMGIISKVEGTGGVINLSTTKEQLLYEVQDPNRYITPDVVADFTKVKLREIAPNQVEVSGAVGVDRPTHFKASVGYHSGFIGEGEISYAGSNAVARARLAGEVIYERIHGNYKELRIDYIGSTSVHRTNFDYCADPYEVRLRVAGKASTLEGAEKIGEEVEALYLNGPAGGGGARKYNHEVIGVTSILIPREEIQTQITIRGC